MPNEIVIMGETGKSLTITWEGVYKIWFYPDDSKTPLKNYSLMNLTINDFINALKAEAIEVTKYER